MEEIRLGTIGSGVIVHSILDNVMRTEGVRLEAVYSRTAEKGEALAAEYGARKVYTNMEAFLADEAVNVVYIATPNLLHHPQAKRALLSGKHVILEKPFCTTFRDARELVEIARQRKLLLVDAVPPSYCPNFEVLKDLLPKIGRLKLVMTNFSQYSSRYDKLLAGELPNIFNPEFAGGCLMDLNFYNIYLNVALFGRPLDADYYPNFYPGAGDTSGVAVLRYDGFVSQNAAAKDTWGVNFVQIEGEQGYLYAAEGSSALTEIRLVTKTGEEVFNEQPNPDRWFYEVQAVTRLLLEENYKEVYRRLDVMLDVIDTLEKARKKAGIRFPGD